MGLFLLLVSVFFFIIFNKLWCFWCRSTVCLVGKTALVTGGASGLGFQTALALAGKGCRIIVADIANLSQSVEQLKKLTYNPHIIGVKVDLKSLKSVREFARIINETEPRLDILVCNAGIGPPKERHITEDGLEITMQVNYFSHFLLTHLLLDLLKKSAPSRIVFTSSLASFFSDVRVDKLSPGQGYYNKLWAKFGGTYNNSKLCIAAASVLFAEKLRGTGVIANASLPFGVVTPIWAALKAERNYVAIFLWLFVLVIGKTAEEGAQTLIHLSHSDKVKNVTGGLFIEGRNSFFRPPKLTGEFCKKLWDASIQMTNLQPHEVKC